MPNDLEPAMLECDEHGARGVVRVANGVRLVARRMVGVRVENCVADHLKGIVVSHRPHLPQPIRRNN